MVQNNGAFSNGQIRKGMFSKEFQTMNIWKTRDAEAMQVREIFPESEQSMERFEEVDSLNRIALMDCYNG